MIESRNPSPRIIHVSWGKLEVEGKTEPYKDAKLFPGGSREWNWRVTPVRADLQSQTTPRRLVALPLRGRFWVGCVICLAGNLEEYRAVTLLCQSYGGRVGSKI